MQNRPKVFFMISKSNKLVFLFMIVLLLPLFSNFDSIIINKFTPNPKILKISAQFTESFIHVNGNWSDMTSYDWCSGDGSWDNPYTIENVTINASNSVIGIGILIENSINDYFKVQNCMIFNVAPNNNYGGIKMNNVTNGTLYRNNCSNNGRSGILLSSCLNCTIAENHVNYNGGLNADNYAALRLVINCHNNTISGNTVNNNNANGIQLRENCVNNTILENTVIDNGEFGIDLWTNCNYNNVTNNIAVGSGRNGINTRTSYSNSISENYLYNNTFLGINCMGTSNTVKNNTASGNYHGIQVYQATNSNISSNTVDDNIYSGLLVFYSNNNNVTGNIANCNGEYGIFCIWSDWNNISQNTLENNLLIGMSVEESNYNTINNNSINNHDLGIGLKQSSSNYVLDNSLSHNNYCIFEFESTGNELLNNNCSTPSIQTPFYIDDLEVGIGAHNWTWALNQGLCSGSGLASDPYIIDNLKISAFRMTNGIDIRNSDAYFIIKNCTIYHSDYFDSTGGIKFSNVTNAQIIENNCSYNFGNGIYLFEYCDDNIISGNIASKNSESGIFIDDECTNNTISHNLVDNNKEAGILLGRGGDASCYNNSISENTVRNNDWGIRIVQACHNSKILNNFVGGNNDGISLDGNNLDYTEITENIIRDNIRGLYISPGSSNNTITRNFFVGNSLHAQDQGSDNKWNSSTIGNYWDNHTGPDIAPQDGIVDTPYIYITGLAGSIDYLPIAEDGPPQINILSPLEGSQFGKKAPEFEIEVFDLYVDEMWYTVDGGLHNCTFIVNGSIAHGVWDILPNGDVTIRFYARDIRGNVGFKDIIVIKNVLQIVPFVVGIILSFCVAGLIIFLGEREQKRGIESK